MSECIHSRRDSYSFWCVCTVHRIYNSNCRKQDMTFKKHFYICRSICYHSKLCRFASCSCCRRNKNKRRNNSCYFFSSVVCYFSAESRKHCRSFCTVQRTSAAKTDNNITLPVCI